MKPSSSGNTGDTNNQHIHVKKTLSKRKQQKEFEPKDKLKQKYDRIAIRDIANLKGVKKGEAALQLVQERRKRDIMDKKDEKFLEDLPWRPKVPYVIEYPPHSLSIFNASDHRRYVAIISNFLLPNPTFRFELNKLELAGLDERLRGEREKFNEIVVSNLEKRKSLKKLPSPFLENQDGSETIFVRRIKSRAREILGELSFSEQVHGFPWSDAAPSTQIPSGSFYLKFLNVFDEGESRRMVIPNPRRKCQFYMNPRVIGENLAAEDANKIAIDKDETALEHALASGVEYVMDGSTLRHFLSAKHLYRDQLFVNKISVIRRVSNGISRRICVISKPVLASRMDALYVNSQFMKWCAKCELHRRYIKRNQLITTISRKKTAVEPKKLVKETGTKDKTVIYALSSSSDCDAPTVEHRQVTSLTTSTATTDAVKPLGVKPSPIVIQPAKLSGLKRRVARLSAATVRRSLPSASSTIEGGDGDDLLTSILTGMSAENKLTADSSSFKKEQKRKMTCELWDGLNEKISKIGVDSSDGTVFKDKDQKSNV